MLLKDFLTHNALSFEKKNVVFDWVWPHARYELKVDSRNLAVHRMVSPSGEFGAWSRVPISDLRDFRIVKMSLPRRKILAKNGLIQIVTDDASR